MFILYIYIYIYIYIYMLTLSAFFINVKYILIIQRDIFSKSVIFRILGIFNKRTVTNKKFKKVYTN